jgi:hypothetical protein
MAAYSCLEHIKKTQYKSCRNGSKVAKEHYDLLHKQPWFIRAVDKVNLWNLILIVISHWTGQEMNMNLFLLPL